MSIPIVRVEHQLPDGQGGYRLELIVLPGDGAAMTVRVLLPGTPSEQTIYEGAQAIMFLRNLRAIIDAALLLVPRE